MTSYLYWQESCDLENLKAIYIYIYIWAFYARTFKNVPEQVRFHQCNYHWTICSAILYIIKFLGIENVQYRNLLNILAFKCYADQVLSEYRLLSAPWVKKSRRLEI